MCNRGFAASAIGPLTYSARCTVANPFCERQYFQGRSLKAGHDISVEGSLIKALPGATPRARKNR